MLLSVVSTLNKGRCTKYDFLSAAISEMVLNIKTPFRNNLMVGKKIFDRLEEISRRPKKTNLGCRKATEIVPGLFDFIKTPSGLIVYLQGINMSSFKYSLQEEEHGQEFLLCFLRKSW